MLRLLLTVLLIVLALSTSATAQSNTVGPKELTATTCPAPAGCAIIDVKGAAAVALQITGTFTATVSFEASVDGVTYVALNMVPSNSATAASSATAPGAFSATIGGYTVVRARVSAYTSGTASVTLQTAAGGGR